MNKAVQKLIGIHKKTHIDRSLSIVLGHKNRSTSNEFLVFLNGYLVCYKFEVYSSFFNTSEIKQEFLLKPVFLLSTYF